MSTSGSANNRSRRVCSVVKARLISQCPLPGVPGSSVMSGGPPCAETKRGVSAITNKTHGQCFGREILVIRLSLHLHKSAIITVTIAQRYAVTVVTEWKSFKFQRK